MAHNLSWMVPQRLILLEVSEILTADEITAIVEKYMGMMDADGVAPVHTLVDARTLDKIDIKVRELPGLLVGGKKDDRFGWTYIVTENRFISFLTNMASQLTASQFKTTDNIEDALNTFVRLDSTLPAEILVVSS